MTSLTVRFSNNISHSSEGILNWESYDTGTNGATYTVFQLTLEQMERHILCFSWHWNKWSTMYCVSAGLYFKSNSCNVLIMITHWTFLNTFIALSECFHAINIPYNKNFAAWITNSIVFFVLHCFVLFIFFLTKTKVYFWGE